ncbi:MarR family winged helix-turn-helix transcriptional regulator [Streptomyces sp. NPDC059698]|uniref:MarR family winged helix-turn-helix transcriptional regulator n=1 Tax=unclassified Streptomyces TaxID=2593676 RepID=UPI0018FE8C6F|nr:MarR family transcriptional regulator [Streptomyces sp. CB02366]WSS54279.1 MarR family transcriptional regulator [Streptomyces sp. NBC_01178]
MDAPDPSGPPGSPAPGPGRSPGGPGDGGDSGPPDTDGMLAEQLLRLTRRLHRIQSRQLEPIDITPAQFRLLRTVASYDASPRMADLARRLDVVPRAVTTLVDALEASGRVRRAPDPDSRRVVRVEITDEGRATLRSLRSARRAAAEEILAPLTADQREVLGGLLSALVDGMPERHC